MTKKKLTEIEKIIRRYTKRRDALTKVIDALEDRLDEHKSEWANLHDTIRLLEKANGDEA